MFCPTCGNQLQKIAVSTNQGGRFEVDHCGFCGGTWFDPYEINRIPFHEIITLANLTVLPKKKVTELKKHLCPGDNHPLEPFQGDAVPKNVKLLWCKKCLGIWAAQKDLWEFKKHQDETVSAYDVGSKFFPALSVVFVPVVTFLFLLATTFTTITSLQQAQDERIHAESRISDIKTDQISGNAVSISFKTQIPFISSAILGPSSLEMEEFIISDSPSPDHNIVLTGLKPRTRYLFRLKLRDGQNNSFVTDLKYFTTSP